MNYGDLTDAGCDAVQMPRAVQGPRMRKLINETLLEICSTLRLSQPVALVTVTPNVGDYSIAAGLGVTDAVQIRDLQYTPVGQLQGAPLRRTSPSRADEIRARTPSNVYPQVFALAGVDTLMLAPVPFDAGSLSVRYVQDGVVLAADSDVPSTIPAAFHDVIWRGAAIKLAEMRRPAAVAQLDARQQRRLGDLRSWLVDVAGSTPMRMERAGTSIPVNDPSIWPQGAY